MGFTESLQQRYTSSGVVRRSLRSASSEGPRHLRSRLGLVVLVWSRRLGRSRSASSWSGRSRSASSWSGLVACCVARARSTLFASVGRQWPYRSSARRSSAPPALRCCFLAVLPTSPASCPTLRASTRGPFVAAGHGRTLPPLRDGVHSHRRRFLHHPVADQTVPSLNPCLAPASLPPLSCCLRGGCGHCHLCRRGAFKTDNCCPVERLEPSKARFVVLRGPCWDLRHKSWPGRHIAKGNYGTDTPSPPTRKIRKKGRT